ncbi:MAG: IS5 family transposase [Nitrospira sp.]|nr:IS5 family transposase [Nitrospira sp.]
MEIRECEGMPEETFRRLTGVRKRTFAERAAVLKIAEAALKQQGGKPNRLAVETRLRMTLEYWREYRTYLHIGHSYGVSESTAYRTIRWCEDVLITSGAFTLPGKHALLTNDRAYEVVLIDATETPVERPPKKQRRDYSGKKKRHTLKTQLVVDRATGRILCLAHDAGRRHNFRLFKESGVRLHPETEAITDTGSMGLHKLHGKTTMPQKRSKKTPLSKQDQQANRLISKDRVPAEHVIACLKRFKIVSDRYRNRRQRFGLRVTLIAVCSNRDMTP